ncbi:MAG: TatD family hydrolase [Bdellovibrionales bacterium]
MLTDTHCHLGYKAMSKDVDGILARAREAGVGRFVTIGCQKNEFDIARNLAETKKDVFFALGIHPHEAEKEGEEISVEELVELSQHPKMVALGEAGLDYFYDNAPREAQERVFRTHIRAAIETGLPLVIHTRDAEEDTIRILSEERKGNEGKLRGVFHCYSSNRELAEFGCEIDFYFSFSGMLTFKKSENVREVAKMVPLNRMFVETDAPYLAPEPFRGKVCEPAYVAHTARFLADLKGIDIKELEAVLEVNYQEFFG